MPQFDPDKRKEDDVLPTSSVDSPDEYHTPPTSKESTKASSSSTVTGLPRTWTESPETKRRTVHEVPVRISWLPPFNQTPGPKTRSTGSRMPIIRANGPPNDVLFQCPEDKTLYYPTVWYRLSAQKDFLACSRCYVSHIKKSPLAHAFERFTPPAGAPSRCRFWVPRVVSALWPRAIRDQSVDNLIEFANRRKAIPDCPEVSGLEETREDRPWATYDEEEPGKVECCEACYEDRVAGTAFADKFEEVAPEPADDDNENKKCVLSIRYIQRALDAFARSDDWTGFVAAVRQRLRASECKGRMVTTFTTDRFTQVGQDEELWICEACFLDLVAMTDFQVHFSQAQDHTLPIAARAQFRCALSAGSVMVALEAALTRNDYGMFGNAIKAITSSKFCSPSGIRGGPWYTLQGGCDNFQICQACYCGIIAPCQMGPFFDLANSQANSDSMVRLCDLNPAAPRFLSYVEKLAQVVDVGDFSVFSKYVRRVAGAKPCLRGSQSNQGIWCCIDGCTVCLDCFETVAANTVFAHRFTMQRLIEPPPVVRSLSSSRMRLKWADACRNGAIEDFPSFAKVRQDIYKQATSTIERIKQVRGSRFGQALAELLFEYRAAAEKGNTLTSREDRLLKGKSRPNSCLVASPQCATLEKLVQETLKGTKRREEQLLIEQLENAWKEID
ncbi:integral membrane protein [Apiospora marii]|uniref:uncharacterized protein n=1 Tax=Apiospora marii TaxID=335849 RepID=UPI00312E6B16